MTLEFGVNLGKQSSYRSINEIGEVSDSVLSGLILDNEKCFDISRFNDFSYIDLIRAQWKLYAKTEIQKGNTIGGWRTCWKAFVGSLRQCKKHHRYMAFVTHNRSDNSFGACMVEIPISLRSKCKFKEIMLDTEKYAYRREISYYEYARSFLPKVVLWQN